LVNKRNIALVGSLLFALHPIHTGRVTNMTAGFDLLGIFLYLLAFYFYILFSKNNKLNYFVVSVIVFIVGLLASEEVATLPLVIILYDFCFLNKKFFEKKKLKEHARVYVPYFVLLVSYVTFRFFVLEIRGRVPGYDSPGMYFTLITMAKVFVGYILLLIFPFNLKLFYDVKVATSIFDFNVLLSMIILIFIIFFTIKFFNKITFFCILWFFITLLPFSNIVPLVVLMAERYLYLASFGFCFLLAFAFDKVYNLDFKKNIKIGLVIFVVLLLLFYSFVIINRNAEWKDNLTLWTETVKDSPNSSRAHDNLGFTYERMGRYKDAIKEFEKAIDLKPANYRAHTNLGVALAKVGLFNISIMQFETALKINPHYYKTYNKLGLVYANIRDYKNAIINLNKAVKLNPNYAKGYNDLGMIYGQLGNFNASLKFFKNAIRLDPDYADAHYNLGVLYNFLGERGLALRELRIAISLEPENGLYRRKLNEII
jgi:tetratricopeptide (TPR) repeat protein